MKSKSQVFISYRKNDAGSEAQRIFEALDRKFPGRVFLDSDGLQGGDDFAKRIFSSVDSCRVVLVIIGPRWATVQADDGRRKLFLDDDVLRQEVEKALKDGSKIVIPVLQQNDEIFSMDSY